MNLERVIAVRTSKTIYRDGDRTVKVFDNDYSKANILNEALNQARVEETGLPIPSILEVTMIEGKWAIISQHIKGKTLEQLMVTDPAHYDEYMDQFVQVQLMVHSKTSPRLNPLRETLYRQIAECDLNATTKYDLHTRLAGMPRENRLCHGDFNPSNVVIAEDGTAYILDWSYATQGNVYADVARTYLLFWLAGDLKGAEQYLKTYCEKSDTAMQEVQKWMSIVAAAQLTEGKAVEREFLLHWINVVNYV